MELIRFNTKYGYKIIGGRFNFARSPSTTEELNAPIKEVSEEVIKKYELDHEIALAELKKSWKLD